MPFGLRRVRISESSVAGVLPRTLPRRPSLDNSEEMRNNGIARKRIVAIFLED